MRKLLQPKPPAATADKRRKQLAVAGRCFPSGNPVELQIADGKVVAIREAALAEQPGVERWIVPGFLDVQVNGFAGQDFLNPKVTIAGCEHIARSVLATGTTRFLATVITAPLETMCHQMEVIATAMATVPLFGRMCLGIHMEGPFINPDDGPRGAHPLEDVRPPNLDDYRRLREAAGGKLRMITVAPERPGAIELIHQTIRDGVLAAIGHHRAESKAINAAVEAGATTCTHLGNGLDAVVPRLDNPLWTQLADDRLYASFICDGHHIPSAAMRCLLRAKSPERSILTTDAVAAAGMSPGPYRQGLTPVELTAAGKVVLPGTPYLAGSAADMPLVVGRAIVDGGLTWQQAISAATENPARLLACSRPWPPTVGQDADLVELDWQPESGRLFVRTAVAGPFVHALQ